MGLRSRLHQIILRGFDQTADQHDDPGFQGLQFREDTDVRRYVEAELNRVLSAHESWRVHTWRGGLPDYLPLEPKDTEGLWWVLTTTEESPYDDSWYTLEARRDTEEFLIWFGHGQVGSGGLHWIIRPAVHVAFQHLGPHPYTHVEYRLGDVLDMMIRSLDSPHHFTQIFEMNTFSLT